MAGRNVNSGLDKVKDEGAKKKKWEGDYTKKVNEWTEGACTCKGSFVAGRVPPR